MKIKTIAKLDEGDYFASSLDDYLVVKSGPDRPSTGKVNVYRAVQANVDIGDDGTLEVFPGTWSVNAETFDWQEYKPAEKKETKTITGGEGDQGC